MTDHLCSQQDSGLIWGCRHIIENVANCFMYVNRKAKYLADQFEPVTREVNNSLPLDLKSIHLDIDYLAPGCLMSITSVHHLYNNNNKSIYIAPL
jgi:hypothetical protein